MSQQPDTLPPPILKRTRYQITIVPDGCEEYTLGQIVNLHVSSPPPALVTLDEGDACDGIIATLHDAQTGQGD